MKLTYDDNHHRYYLDGRRAKSVTAVAKIPTETFTLEQWDKRQVAIGLAVDRNLIENIAVNIDNKDVLNDICEQAKTAAKAHLAADRGTQMHHVLSMILLDKEEKLLTDQQRADAELLKRTLDRYKLTPYDYLTEQFVAWPHYTVTGRFDAVLEKADGTLILTDLKSGPNAVRYPHSTAVQLALYARAPHISDNIHVTGDRSTVSDWREMPPRLELRYGYVLLVEPDSEIGSLHEMDIEHGWAAAQMALRIVEWRKQLDYGRSMVTEILPEPSWPERISVCETLDELTELWREARKNGADTPDFLALCGERKQQLLSA